MIKRLATWQRQDLHLPTAGTKHTRVRSARVGSVIMARVAQRATATVVALVACLGIVSALAPLNSLPEAVSDVVAANVNNQSYVFAASSTFQLDLGLGTWATISEVLRLACAHRCGTGCADWSLDVLRRLAARRLAQVLWLAPPWCWSEAVGRSHSQTAPCSTPRPILSACASHPCRPVGGSSAPLPWAQPCMPSVAMPRKGGMLCTSPRAGVRA